MENHALGPDGGHEVPQNPARVQLTGIAKRYGAVRAISNADIVLYGGRVHALVGENGAGKSTLIKILAGAESTDAGLIEFDGRPVTLGTTSSSIALGIATVYQEPQLFQELTVAENIFAGRELRRHGRIDWAKQHEAVVELLALIGLEERYAPMTVSDLSIAEQQQVSIAKALAQDVTVLILDEPSAILTDAEIENLFTVIRRLQERNVAVVYISHRLDELARIADEVTIMRDGRTIATHEMKDVSIRAIAEAMVGGMHAVQSREHKAEPGPARFELVGLARSNRFHDVNVTVAAGEIVALYGLVGSGASDIAATIFGILKADAGTMLLDGSPVTPRNPRHAQKLRIALLPADRKRQGMFAFQTIAFNVSIGHLPLLTKFGLWVDRKRETVIAKDMITRLAVRTPNELQAIGALSGGNAQKVVLARQLVVNPRLLILEEPTQGVDIGAKEEIHLLISQMADQGTAVLVVTSDLPEALRVADRIQIVRKGTTTVTLPPTASQVDLLAAAAGEEPENSQEGAGHENR
ncbi:sugar ABC transporter ATP-binding protein [Cryobacterium glaciale]|uniref:Sugar ABC transporter ATP-binding protein n=1 Tax=Cryobacterium glaciale TaxID=1259145 RepID=A0A4R8V127_9MICO|nr:sugar ABC transporter ATP-binding protein [Cryobacterium glaciale]TFB75872.1 sugar ABC transporter ATP-binding protein [Cryobacterium glaciale]